MAEDKKVEEKEKKKKDFFHDDNSFLLYKRWNIILKSLPVDEVGLLFLALYDYAITGNQPDFTPGTSLYTSFLVMSDQILFEGKKWEKKCNTNSKNGSKGGRPPKDASKARDTKSQPKKTEKSERKRKKPIMIMNMIMNMSMI